MCVCVVPLAYILICSQFAELNFWFIIVYKFVRVFYVIITCENWWFLFFPLLLVKESGEREVEGERFHVGRKQNGNSSTLRSFEKKFRNNNVLRHLSDSKSSILSISLWTSCLIHTLNCQNKGTGYTRVTPSPLQITIPHELGPQDQPPEAHVMEHALWQPLK